MAGALDVGYAVTAVRYETHEHCAVVTIDRPQARHAVNGAVAAGLEAALDRIEADDDVWIAISPVPRRRSAPAPTSRWSRLARRPS